MANSGPPFDLTGFDLVFQSVAAGTITASTSLTTSLSTASTYSVAELSVSSAVTVDTFQPQGNAIPLTYVKFFTQSTQSTEVNYPFPSALTASVVYPVFVSYSVSSTHHGPHSVLMRFTNATNRYLYLGTVVFGSYSVVDPTGQNWFTVDCSKYLYYDAAWEEDVPVLTTNKSINVNAVNGSVYRSVTITSTTSTLTNLFSSDAPADGTWSMFTGVIAIPL